MAGFPSDLDRINDPILPTSRSNYFGSTNSFSGCDIRAIVHTDDGNIVTIGNLSTLTYSVHRERYPVRALGYRYPKGYTAGGVTVAGTMIFAVFDRYALYDIAKQKARLDNGIGEAAYSLQGHQMAPFDVSCIFINELGHQANLNIYGVQFVDESQTMSVNDIYIESSHSYVADDMDVMFPGLEGKPLRATNLMVPETIYKFDTVTGQVLTSNTIY
jgi:hypothetical protein